MAERYRVPRFAPHPPSGVRSLSRDQRRKELAIRTLILTSLASLSLVALGGCSDPTEPVHNDTMREAFDMSSDTPDGTESSAADAKRTARAVVKGTDGKVLGEATLVESDDGVELSFEARNLPPGPHGFHVHETGDCSAADFKSAGGHFAPDKRTHGHMEGTAHHVGDMGNIEVPEDGTISVSRTLNRANLRDDPNDIHSLLTNDGTAIVIHEGRDDGESQPSGAAGSRIACGVIQAGSKG